MALRKTKIVCTMGPTTNDIEIIKQLLIAGMNVARFNFSHGDHSYHKSMIKKVRQASLESGIPVALLLDTKGPEIRTGLIKDNATIELFKEKKITLTTDIVEGSDQLLSISYKQLPQEVEPGKHIYIADGLIDLEVVAVNGPLIDCVIKSGGEIGSKKNVNVIGVKTSLPAITDKDKKDILLAIEQKMDFIAASFIRKPTDVLEIQNILDEHHSSIKIISKIEDEEGLENIDEIIRVSGGIMIARGDLGVQLSTEMIPLAQKRIIEKCNKQNKPVITATQMLDSMIYNPRPTRAELTDVANAIFDGTDAVMLSGETANGKFPVKTVETMQRIALTVEQSPEYLELVSLHTDIYDSDQNIKYAIARAANLIAKDIQASAIVAPTLSGNTAKLMSKFRPIQNIIAVTTSELVQRQLLLYWGVYPIVTELVDNSDVMLMNALKVALKTDLVNNFDKVVMLAGVPIHSPIMLNMIKIHIICNILNKGEDGMGDICSGTIVKANDVSEAIINLKLNDQEILVTRVLDESFRPLIKNLKGIILEEYSLIPYEEIEKINPRLVIISEVPHALAQFEDNFTVSLNGKEKIIYEGFIENDSLPG